MLPRSTRRSALTGAVLTLALLLAACGSDGSEGSEGSGGSTSSPSETADQGASEAPNVVASTSWVGAVAKLAGATDITVIAPTNVTHPPDYDPKASDLVALDNADYILLAGFEGFADRMREAAGTDAEVLEVVTDYDPAKVREQAMALAEAWGTEDVAEENVSAYEQAYGDAMRALQAQTGDAPQKVVAQQFVAGWAAFAGYEPVGTYGPEPTTPSQVAELTGLEPTLVFENSHMGGGDEIAASSGAQLVPLVNFPGDDLELMAVVETNVDLIEEAIG